MLNKNFYASLFDDEMIQYLNEIPYDVSRDTLYTTEELFSGFIPEKPETLSQCFDSRVFRFYNEKGHECSDFRECLARVCHDSSIYNAVNDMLKDYHPRKVVGIMGGHGLNRNDPYYRKIVLFQKKITEMGWLVVTGGGPGAMEASHVGAWFAGQSQENLDEALRILLKADTFSDPDWVSTSVEVCRRFPRQSGFRSLAVPTWVYGHEPPIFFATDTAKFFSNSIREDTLLYISFGGLLFCPGSAGTFREVFQKLVHNHYLTWDYPSPMIFVDSEFWTERVPFYPAVREMLKSRQFRNLLVSMVDEVDDAVEIISDFENLYPMIAAKPEEKRHVIEKMFAGENPDQDEFPH